MSRYKKNLGDWGEDQACLFLERHNFKVIERNYHTTVGEIDIIAQKGDDYYFIEVKTRKSGDDLANDSSITNIKKYRLAKSIKHYCFHRRIENCSIVLAGLIVVVDRLLKKASLRFCVLY